MLKERVYRFRDTIVNNPSFTVKEQLGYAGGIFGNAMGQDSVGTFTNKFCRNYMGLNNTRITIMENVHFVANFIVNPIAGNILDKPAKEGKQTPTKKILKATPIPFAIASMLLFVVPSPNAFYNFIWAMLLKMIFGIVDSFYDMSLNTMSLRMTNNAKDRKNFYTVSTLASSLGSMLPGSVIPIFVGMSDDATKQKWTYFFMALIFCVLGVSAMFAPYFTLNEKIKVEQKETESVISWDRNTINALVHNRTFIIVQVASFFEQVRRCSYELLLYLYEDIFDDLKMKPIIDTVSGSLSYAGLAVVPFIMRKFSARTVMSMSFAYTGFFYTIMALFGINFNLEKIRKYRYLIGLCIGLAGMPNNAMSAAKKVVVGDSTDYMEWYSEKEFGEPIHAEGLICSTQAICTTLFNLIVMNIYNPMFNKIGYKESTVIGGSEKATQSVSTLRGLYLMFTLFGVIGNYLASASYLFDNYTGARKDTILAELYDLRKIREEKEAELKAE